MTIKIFALALALGVGLGLGACTKTKPAGTHPGDMTAEQHREACQKHKQEAAAYQERADKLDGGKGTYTAASEAKTHDDVAAQHEAAGKQVDPNLAACE